MQKFVTFKEPPPPGMGLFRKSLKVYIDRKVDLMAKKYPFEHEVFPMKCRQDYAGVGGLWMEKRVKAVATRQQFQNEFNALWKKHVTERSLGLS